jgi:hypothetical protein
VDAGRLPPLSNRFDPTFRFYTFFDAVDWESGKSQTGLIGVVIRPSMLYTALFATLSDKSESCLKDSKNCGPDDNLSRVWMAILRVQHKVGKKAALRSVAFPLR